MSVDQPYFHLEPVQPLQGVSIVLLTYQNAGFTQKAGINQEQVLITLQCNNVIKGRGSYSFLSARGNPIASTFC